ncbi:hypothetical protein Tco_0203061 [Tanacetum coccineum]
MFDTGALNGDEVFQEPILNTDTTTKSSIPISSVDPVTTACEVVTTASVEILEELVLAQTLIEIKKPEKPLKKKDQIAIDEEVARNLEAQLQANIALT